MSNLSLDFDDSRGKRSGIGVVALFRLGRSENLVETKLKSLDAGKHVKIAGRILLDDICDVVRPQRLAELAPRHEILDLAERANRVLLLQGELRFAVR